MDSKAKINIISITGLLIIAIIGVALFFLDQWVFAIVIWVLDALLAATIFNLKKDLDTKSCTTAVTILIATALLTLTMSVIV